MFVDQKGDLHLKQFSCQTDSLGQLNRFELCFSKSFPEISMLLFQSRLGCFCNSALRNHVTPHSLSLFLLFFKV